MFLLCIHNLAIPLFYFLFRCLILLLTKSHHSMLNINKQVIDMDNITRHILDAATIAADLSFSEMCVSSAPLMIAVEDTSRDDVIGFGKVFITNEYYHPKLVRCSNNSKMHIRMDWSHSRIKTEIFDFLRRVNILPRFIEIEDEIINLDKKLNELKVDVGYFVASKQIEELKLKFSSIAIDRV